VTQATRRLHARPWPRGLLAALIAVLVMAASAATVLGADPTASPLGGDVRTTPAAPGLVGDPLFAVVGVAVVGLVALAVTLLATRLGRRR